MRTFSDLWPVLLGLALVTYFTRVGGLWMVSRVSTGPRLARLLGHLGTGVLSALVVFGLRDGDPGAGAAVCAALLLMRATGQMLVAVSGAAITAAVVRALF